MNKKIKIHVDGMYCSHCEEIIEKSIKKLEGVIGVKASYARANVVILFNCDKVSEQEIRRQIAEAGYTAEYSENQDGKIQNLRYLGIGIIIVALYLIMQNTTNYLPQIQNNTGYGLLFIIGVFTSLHCLAMCGGLAISQTLKKESTEEGKKSGHMLPTLLYNLGRVVSYTILGGIVGGIGSVISLSGQFKGAVAIMAGILMMIMGLSMLNISPLLKKINISMPFGSKILSGKRKRSPLLVGFLNGLMPCGPLQTMQLYALGTGSIFQGALSMLIFALGTLPLMTLLGYLTTFLSSKFTHKILKLSAVLIVILGLVMTSRGLVLAGIIFPSIDLNRSSINNSGATIAQGKQIIKMSANERGYTPSVFFVQKGIPVKWIITGDSINYCNNEIIVPEYNISKKISPGENVLEFTPNESGELGFSCWMGMISGRIKVVDDLGKITEADRKKEQVKVSLSPKSGCGNIANQGEVTEKDISISKVNGEKQQIIMNVDSKGYNPRVFLVEKEKTVEFIINAKDLGSCTYALNFVGTQYEIPLMEGKNILEILPKEKDVIAFTCPMGMLSGYIVVIDDLKKVDKKAILQQVKQVRLPSSGCGMPKIGD